MDLKDRINQAKDIKDGFKNLLLSKLGLLSEDIVEEGLRRAAICSGCPLLLNEICNSNMEGTVVKDFVYYGKTFKKGDKNKGCGCSMKSKWLSPSAKCPLNKFDLELIKD